MKELALLLLLVLIAVNANKSSRLTTSSTTTKKPGSCPVKNGIGSCIMECQDDSTCSDDFKCVSAFFVC